MAEPSYAPVSISPRFSVIGPQFVAPYEFNLIVNRHSNGDLVITDTNHKIMITVKSCDTSMHTQRLLRDANETPIALLREKVVSETNTSKCIYFLNMSAHDRWNVYRGESIADQDMIFNTVSNHMIQFKTHINVFLANKTSSRDDCDFKIKGNWSKKNCKIYMGDSSTEIAQMLKMQPPANKDKYMVTIYPNVDYAFVVSLIAIVDAMNSQNTDEVVAAAAGGATEAVVGSTMQFFSAG